MSNENIKGFTRISINKSTGYLNPCGDYNPRTTYSWDNNKRDTVRYNNTWWAVKKFGSSFSNILPTNTDFWIESESTDFLYANCIQTKHLSTESVTGEKLNISAKESIGMFLTGGSKNYMLGTSNIFRYESNFQGLSDRERFNRKVITKDWVVGSTKTLQFEYESEGFDVIASAECKFSGSLLTDVDTALLNKVIDLTKSTSVFKNTFTVTENMVDSEVLDFIIFFNNGSISSSFGIKNECIGDGSIPVWAQAEEDMLINNQNLMHGSMAPTITGSPTITDHIDYVKIKTTAINQRYTISSKIDDQTSEYTTISFEIYNETSQTLTPKLILSDKQITFIGSLSYNKWVKCYATIKSTYDLSTMIFEVPQNAALFRLRRFKIENGTIPTPWINNASDVVTSALNLVRYTKMSPADGYWYQVGETRDNVYYNKTQESLVLNIKRNASTSACSLYKPAKRVKCSFDIKAYDIESLNDIKTVELIGDNTFASKSIISIENLSNNWQTVKGDLLIGTDNTIRFTITAKQQNTNINANVLVRNLMVVDGDSYSEWSECPGDISTELLRTGIDIAGNQITATADQFKIQNKSGQPIAVFDGESDTPTIRATCINSDEVIAKNIHIGNNAGIYGLTYVPSGKSSIPRFYTGIKKNGSKFTEFDAADVLSGNMSALSSYAVISNDGRLKCNDVELSGTFKLSTGVNVEDQIKNDINNVSIGARNLVLDSLINETSNLYGFAERKTSDPLCKQCEYTIVANGRISEEAKANGYKLAIYLDWYQQVLLLDNTTDGTFVATFKVADYIPTDTIGTIRALCFPDGGNRAGTATLNWVAIYKGNKAPADWTPAPEDSINDLQIGGTNLLYNLNAWETPSYIWKFNDRYTLASQNLKSYDAITSNRFSVSENKNYILSFDVVTPAFSVMAQFRIYKNESVVDDIFVQFPTIIGKNNINFKIPKGVDCNNAALKIYSNNDGGSFIIKDLKIEEATKSTYWSPSPKDLEGKSVNLVLNSIGSNWVTENSFQGVYNENYFQHDVKITDAPAGSNLVMSFDLKWEEIVHSEAINIFSQASIDGEWIAGGLNVSILNKMKDSNGIIPKNGSATCEVVYKIAEGAIGHKLYNWMIRFDYVNQGASVSIRNLRCNEGLNPMMWAPSPEDIETKFEVESGRITAAVTDLNETKTGLQTTGINITNGLVELNAEKFKINDSSGNPMAMFTKNSKGNPELITDRINAEQLIVKNLKTSETGVKIEATGNTLKMLDEQDSVKLLISGNQYNSVSDFINSSGSGSTSAINMASKHYAYAGTLTDSSGMQEDYAMMTGQIQVPQTGQYEIKIPSINVKVSGIFNGRPGTGSIISGYGRVTYNIILFDETNGNPIKTIASSTDFLNPSNNIINETYTIQSAELALPSGRLVSIRLRTFIEYRLNYELSENFNTTITATPLEKAYVSISEITNNTAIFNNGLGYKASTSKYAVIMNSPISDDPVFETRSGSFGLRVTSKGIFKMTNGIDWVSI